MNNYTKFSLLLLLSLYTYFSSDAQVNFESPYIIPSNGESQLIFIEDLDKDSINELVLVNLNRPNGLPNDKKIMLYQQNEQADLVLIQEIMFTTEWINPKSLGAEFADMNMDGYDEMILTFNDDLLIYKFNLSTQQFEILHEIIDITHDIPSHQLETTIWGLAVGDINIDGFKDIAIAINYGNQLKICLNQDDSGTNYSISEVPTNGNVKNLTIEKLGTWDTERIIFVKSFRLYSMNPSNGDYTIELLCDTKDYIYYSDLDFDDLNNDGYKDIICATPENNISSTPNKMIHFFYYSAAEDSFSYEYGLPAYDLPEPMVLTDINKDGKKELAILHGGWLKMSVYEKDETGKYDEEYDLFGIPYATHYDKKDGFAIGDINNDGFIDAAIADYNHGIVILYGAPTLSDSKEIVSLKGDPIKVFPHPVSDKLSISIEDANPVKPIDLEIFDIDGKRVFKGQEDSASFEIDLSQYAVGMYFLHICIDDRIYVKKIVKQKV